MKNTLFLFRVSAILSLLLSLAALAQDNEWLKQAVGSYRSQIESSSVHVPGTTEFLLTETGTLIGAYRMEEASSAPLGVLSQCETFDVRTIACTWTDKYGSGTLEVTFSEDFSSFVGQWNLQGQDARFAWSGAR